MLSSRGDPPLPLPLLRAHGWLVELRAADLRVIPDEAAAFLNEVMRLELTAERVAALEARTEGCIAGLQHIAMLCPYDTRRADTPVAGQEHRMGTYQIRVKATCPTAGPPGLRH